MAKVQINPDFFEIDGRVRIERGLGIKRGVIATPELLASIHEGYSTQVRWEDGVARDQEYKVIEHGKPMAYVDHFNPKVWFVFRLENDPTFQYYEENNEVIEAKDGRKFVVAVKPPVLNVNHPMHNKRWVEHGQFATLEEADAFAATL